MTAIEPSTAASAKDWAQLKAHDRAPEQVGVRLKSWLALRLEDAGLEIGPLSAPGGTGVANETLLFDVRHSSGVVSGYVARVATGDPLYLDDDLSTHYRMYEAMASIPAVPTPSVLGYEPDAAVLGSPFFVMEKIVGATPTDNPPWWTDGFVAEASPTQRAALWENTVRLMADFHRIDPEPFAFLRTGATADGVGDSLDYWIRSLRWASPAAPIPLTEIAEDWLLAHRPAGTALSWGDSRLPNVMYREYAPVAMLDWDLASLAGPQADLAWWILMTAPGSIKLDGIGTNNEMIELWEDLTGETATDLRWFLVFGAYRLAAILAKLFSTFVAQGRMSTEAAQMQLGTGTHVQMLAGLLDLTPPPGVVPVVPDIRLDR